MGDFGLVRELEMQSLFHDISQDRTYDQLLFFTTSLAQHLTY